MTWSAPSARAASTLLGTAHGRDLGSEYLCNLHGERTDAAGRTDDKNFLPGLDAAHVAKSQQRGDAGDGNGCGLLERHIARLRHQAILRGADVLGKGSADFSAHSEYFVAGLKLRHLAADCGDTSGEICSGGLALGLEQPSDHDAHKRGLAAQYAPVERIDGGRHDFDQDLVLCGRGFFHVLEPQNIGRPVFLVDDRFHRIRRQSSMTNIRQAAAGRKCWKAWLGRGSIPPARDQGPRRHQVELAGERFIAVPAPEMPQIEKIRTTNDPAHRFCVAPMMDWTDRHCRYFHRLLSPHARLYTEMVHAQRGAARRSRAAARFRSRRASGRAAARRQRSARCSRRRRASARELGYDEINLNFGCPSDRVQAGRFGACLMREPALVADCVAAMRAAVAMPVTVKCRLGVDDAGRIRRSAALRRHGRGRRLRRCSSCTRARPGSKGCRRRRTARCRRCATNGCTGSSASARNCTIVINGGIATRRRRSAHLQHVDGVMLGRAAYHDPYLHRRSRRRALRHAAAGSRRSCWRACGRTSKRTSRAATG